MDKERKKKMQTIKVIITEILMVVAIIAIVIVLTFLAMGYNVNKDGEVGQSGLLQIKSIPTGATVEIDGETMFAKTNMSRMLSSGSHKVKLSRDGYDTWSKELISESGWLLKIDYPRLFLQDRVPEKIKEIGGTLKLVTFDHEGSQILYAVHNDTKWKLANIRGDNITETEINVAKYIPREAEIRRTIWNKNNDKVLVEIMNETKIEWALINLRDVDSSLNLTQQFGLDISKAEFYANNGERLVVIENGNLRSIVAGDRTISQVMAKNVEDFYNEETNLIYIAQSDEKKVASDNAPVEVARRMMLYQEGTDDILITQLNKKDSVKMALSEYLGKKYISFTVNEKLYVYRGDYPNGDRSLSDMQLLVENDIASVPEELVVWTEDQLIMAKNGEKVAMFDAELSKLSQYQAESSDIFFLTKHLIGVNADGKVIVRDFDGENRRELASADSKATISKNNKWLYYFKKTVNGVALYREKILE